jgi:hypothetical protein
MPLYVAKRVWDWLLKKWIKVVGDFTHLTWKHYTDERYEDYRPEVLNLWGAPPGGRLWFSGGGEGCYLYVNFISNVFILINSGGWGCDVYETFWRGTQVINFGNVTVQSGGGV